MNNATSQKKIVRATRNLFCFEKKKLEIFRRPPGIRTFGEVVNESVTSFFPQIFIQSVIKSDYE